MHILFIHQNYPAQFGHIARQLAAQGMRCTFISERPPGNDGGVRRIQYEKQGGSTQRTHFLSRSFENFTWQSHAVYEKLRSHREIRPDIVVGHCGFGSTLFLADLYDCPIVNLFEWYYQREANHAPFLDARPNAQLELNTLRMRTRNAMMLADLQACTAGYCPMNWQRTQFPQEYQSKLRTIFDGVDTNLWRPQETSHSQLNRFLKEPISKGMKVVTYVSRGFETMRGFDVFIKIAQRICELRSDVVVVCVGSDRVCYGSDDKDLEGESYREHVLNQGEYDTSRIRFIGNLPPSDLSELLSASDLHIYLTQPFVLSWSLINALACGCVVLASDTLPLREVIDPGVNGFLAPYHDVEQFAQMAVEILDDPPAYRHVSDGALNTVHERYSLDRTLPQMVKLYEDAINARSSTATSTAADSSFNASHQISPRQKASTVLSWPETPPRKRHLDEVSSFGKSHAFWKQVPQQSPQQILQLGAWRGGLTRFLAQSFPNARIIAGERWHDPNCKPAEFHWKSACDDVPSSFFANLWEHRERVVPVSGSSAEVLQWASEQETEPDMIFIDAESTSEEELTLIGEAHRLFPEATITGTNWSWKAARDVILRTVSRCDLEIAANQNLWAFWQGTEQSVVTFEDQQSDKELPCDRVSTFSS